MSGALPWTPEEDAYLGQRWGKDSPGAIARHLGRTLQAVRGRATRLGLRGRKHAPPPRQHPWRRPLRRPPDT